MKDIIDLANHAAVQSDRWMFVALLIVTIASAFVLVRYMLTQNKVLTDSQMGMMGKMTEQAMASARDLGEVVKRNAISHEENSRALREHTEQLSRLANESANLREHCMNVWQRK